MNKPNFDITLIARNESKTLPRLIESLKEFKERGGVINLLDTGSTDGTADIARSLGCNVEEVGEKFIITIDKETADKINGKFIVGDEGDVVKEGDRMFDYAGARNYAANMTDAKVIATPDCDEIYTKFDIDKINEAIEAGADQLEYNFVFAHDAEGNPVTKFTHCKFYNKEKLTWKGIIHEILVPIEGGGDVVKTFLDESIIKLEHFQNHETNRKGYMTGLAYDFFMNPTNDRNAHYFARELFYNFKFKSSIEAFKVHIEMNGWAAERARSMIFIGEALMAEGKTQEAFSWFLRAFDTEPNSREPFMEIAEYYYRIKNPHKLIPYVAAALQIKGVDFYANYQPYYEHYPHEMMYWALWNIGEISAASEHFKVCLAYRPFEPKYLHDMRWFIDLPKMTFIIPTLGRPEGLKRCLDSIKNLNYPQEKIKVVIASDGEPIDKNIEDGLIDGRDLLIEGKNGRQGVPHTLKDAVTISKPAEGESMDWIVYASNDVEFTPDSLIIALKTAMDNNKRFMAFNTGDVYPNKGNICEHFMIHRSMLDKIDGEIFDTEFKHVGVDNLLYEKLNRLNQFMRCERAIVNHYHFSKTGEPMDEVYKLAWNDEDVKHDRDLLAKKLDELKNKPIQL